MIQNMPVKARRQDADTITAADELESAPIHGGELHNRRLEGGGLAAPSSSSTNK
jgi:hypothetical protein